jgi:hypothetical protein
MRKMLAIALVGSLMLTIVPGAALAGDRHAANDVWAGVALGATAAVVGGVLLNALAAPPVPVAPLVVYTPPPVVYRPAPPVMYATPPPVVYAPVPPAVYRAPVVIYKPAPVVIHRRGNPRGHWKHERHEYERGWRYR